MRVKFLLLLVFLFCANANASSEKSNISIGVMSLLGDSADISLLGVTIFGNETIGDKSVDWNVDKEVEAEILRIVKELGYKRYITIDDIKKNIIEKYSNNSDNSVTYFSVELRRFIAKRALEKNLDKVVILVPTTISIYDRPSLVFGYGFSGGIGVFAAKVYLVNAKTGKLENQGRISSYQFGKYKRDMYDFEKDAVYAFLDEEFVSDALKKKYFDIIYSKNFDDRAKKRLRIIYKDENYTDEDYDERVDGLVRVLTPPYFTPKTYKLLTGSQKEELNQLLSDIQSRAVATIVKYLDPIEEEEEEF